jgi:hypothetical protein
MSTIRVNKKENPFAQISNTVLRDNRLSPEALGILCHLLGNTDGWTIRMDQIRKDRRLGEDKLQSIMKELLIFGYAELNAIKTETGKFAGTYWDINEIGNDISFESGHEQLKAYKKAKNAHKNKDTEKADTGQSGNYPKIRIPLDKNTKDLNSYPKTRAKKGEGKLEKIGMARLDNGKLGIIFQPKSLKQELTLSPFEFFKLEQASNSKLKIDIETGEIIE